MARILVAEKIAEPGLQRMRDAGHEVDIQVGLSPEELIEAVVGAHALIIRSATTVTAQVINSGKDLMLVGRAGVGLDNVDVAAATEAGVLVANAPLSNVVSAAEQTLALILATARNLPQAHSALTQGRWERSAWTGVELQGKTLAIVGLGRIGRLVATRAAAFDMRLIGYDPYVTQESAAEAGVELVSLDDIAVRADFLTLHVAKTPDTVDLIDAAFLAKAKATLRVINVARGGIVNEAGLAEAIASGQIAGAGIDVWETEPTTESPLFALPSVVVAPHLGASTAEAQDKAGDAVADQVLAALSGEPVEFAVNA
jgi:D-3-phosphoglycerate dehydrogenase